MNHKHRLAALAAALISTLAASAQLDFQTTWPPSLKLVRVTATDVNLRRAASAKSARLMRVCEDESDICDLEWSGQSRRQGYPVHPEKGEVMQKTGTQGEWTRVKVEEGFEAYMLSKFCTPQTGIYYALTAADRAEEQLYERTAGDYKGLCIMADQGGLDTDCGLYIGDCVSNGAYVFKYFLPADFYIDESLPASHYKIQTAPDNNNRHTFTFGSAFAQKDSYGNVNVNFNRLGDITIQKVIENSKAQFQKASLVLFKTEDGMIHRIEY